MRTYIFILVIIMFQSCGSKENIETQIIGEWLSYRTEQFVKDKINFLGKGDSLETFYSIKQRFEFNRDGKGRELTLSPDDVFSFNYVVKDSILLFYDRKYKIEKINTDTLILAEFDEETPNYIDSGTTTSYQTRIHFKRVK